MIQAENLLSPVNPKNKLVTSGVGTTAGLNELSCVFLPGSGLIQTLSATIQLKKLFGTEKSLKEQLGRPEALDRILPGAVSCEQTSYSGKIKTSAISYLELTIPPLSPAAKAVRTSPPS